MNAQHSQVNNINYLNRLYRADWNARTFWRGKCHPCESGDLLLHERFILLFNRLIRTREGQQRQEQPD